TLQVKFDYLKQKVTSGSARFNHCEQLAQKLMGDDNLFSERVENHQKELKQSWNSLLDHIDETTRELQEAGEIHIFRREVEDLIARMREKEQLMGKEIGEDLATIKSQQLMLERFERDFAILEIQEQNMMNNSTKLQATYEGSRNMELVLQQEAHLQEAWNNLQKKIAKRKEQLSTAAERKLFMIDTHNLLDWTHDVQANIKEKETPHNVEEALALKINREQLKADLEARKDAVSNVIKTGRFIVDDADSNSSNKQKAMSESSSDSNSDSESSDSEYDYAPSFIKIQDDIQELSTRWTELSDEVDNRVRSLESVIDILNFDVKIRKFLDKIRDKNLVLERHEEDAQMLLKKYASDDNNNFHLERIQDLIRRHQAFEQDTDILAKEIESMSEEGKSLIEQIPDANDHISAKLTTINDAISQLKDKSKQRSDTLHQAEKVQNYFDNYHELMNLLNEMLNKITAPHLPLDVAGAQLLCDRHNDYKTQMDARKEEFGAFEVKGRSLCKEGHFMKEEIEKRIDNLMARGALLVETWKARHTIYKHHLDIRMYMRDAEDFEVWLLREEFHLKNDDLGNTVEEVEELLRRHKDFLSAIDAHSYALESVKRLTIIEDSFYAQKHLENHSKKESSSNDKEIANKMEESIKKIEEEEKKSKQEKSESTDEEQERVIHEISIPEVNGVHGQEERSPPLAMDDKSSVEEPNGEIGGGSSSSDEEENEFLDAPDGYSSDPKRDVFNSSSESSSCAEKCVEATDKKKKKKKKRKDCRVM
ncbi:hypothetical protein SK128_027361, partial [Halocaridina rubra]